VSDDAAAPVLLRPRWIVGHVLVVVLAVAFVALGFWQLSRNDEKHDAEAAARAEYAAPAPALGPAGGEPPSGTRVEVTGTYAGDDEVLLRNRVRSGTGGYDVLTPLRLDDGTAVIVDRGWVSRAIAENDGEALTPPDGTVRVRGPVGEPRTLNPDDTVDERGGRATLPRVDLERIGNDLGYPLRPVYVTAQWQDPTPVDDVPALPEPPSPDDVNHLSYAFQWFAFALIPLVGWPIVLFRVTRRSRASSRRAPAVEPDPPPLAAHAGSGDTRPRPRGG
jgi:cytochrome oxidase assembly protein ShyY1